MSPEQQSPVRCLAVARRLSTLATALVLVAASPGSALAGDSVGVAAFDLETGERLWEMTSVEAGGSELFFERDASGEGEDESPLVLERRTCDRRQLTTTLDPATGEVLETLERELDASAPLEQPRTHGISFVDSTLGRSVCVDDAGAERRCVGLAGTVHDAARFDDLVAAVHSHADELRITTYRLGEKDTAWHLDLVELLGLDAPPAVQVALATHGSLLVAQVGEHLIGIDIERGTVLWQLDGAAELGLHPRDLHLERSSRHARFAFSTHLMAVAWEARVAVYSVAEQPPRLLWSLDPKLDRVTPVRIAASDGRLFATFGARE